MRERAAWQREEEDPKNTPLITHLPSISRFLIILQKYFVIVMEDEKKTRNNTVQRTSFITHPPNSFTVFSKSQKFSKTEESDGRRKEEEKQQCEENPKMVQITNSIESYS